MQAFFDVFFSFFGMFLRMYIVDEYRTKPASQKGFLSI